MHVLFLWDIKKDATITNAFQQVSKEFNRKPNKIWLDKGSEFYNKSWLEKNAVEMYSTHNEGKSVAAERFIRTLKNKVYKYMTSISKNMYIDKLDDVVNKYNNTYHSTIKMKPVDVKSNTYINFSKKVNETDPKFKLVIVLEYQNTKNFLQKFTLEIGQKKILWLKKVKNTVPWAYVINDLNGEEAVGTFLQKRIEKDNQKRLELKK